MGELTLSETAVRPDRATVAVIEFGDYECSYCGRFAREGFPKLEHTYLQPGRVAFDFRHYPLTTIHTQALPAAKAAECARSQGQYWTMHHALFAQPGSLARPDLVARAASLHLDRGSFETCLADNAPGRIARDMVEGTRLGVRSVPTFFGGDLAPDGRVQLRWRVGGASFEALQDAIERLLDRSPQ